MGSDRAPHRVEVVAAATPDIVDAVARLMAQLTTRYTPDAASIADLVSSPNAALILARDADNEVVGTITVAWHPTVCGLLARLETVVVSEVARRRGVASALLEAAEDVARAAGAEEMEFWTGSTRAGARAFYEDRGYASQATVGFSKSLQPAAVPASVPPTHQRPYTSP